MDDDNPFDIDDELFSQCADMLAIDEGNVGEMFGFGSPVEGVVIDQAKPLHDTSFQVETVVEEEEVVIEDDIECEEPVDIPGPAGKRIPKASSFSTQTKWGTEVDTKSATFFRGNMDMDHFIPSSAWIDMKTNLQPSCSTKISDLKVMSSSQKIRRIVGMISNLVIVNRCGFISLSDPSGILKGVVHDSVMKERQSELRTGSVLVLKDISLLVCEDQRCLNITPKNIETIFQSSESM